MQKVSIRKFYIRKCSRFYKAGSLVTVIDTDQNYSLILHKINSAAHSYYLNNFNYSSCFTCRQLNYSNTVSWKQTCEDLSYICTFKGYSSPSLCRKLEFNPSRAEQLQMLQCCASCAFPMTKDSACSAFSLWKNRNRYFNRLLLSNTWLLVDTSEYKFLYRIC